MDALLIPLMVYAACGLVLSLAVHILSFFGVTLGSTTLFTALHDPSALDTCRADRPERWQAAECDAAISGRPRCRAVRPG